MSKIRSIEEWEMHLTPTQIKNAIFFQPTTGLKRKLSLEECLEWVYGDKQKILDLIGEEFDAKEKKRSSENIERV